MRRVTRRHTLDPAITLVFGDITPQTAMEIIGIGERRLQQRERLRAALVEGDTDRALAIARELCGLEKKPAA